MRDNIAAIIGFVVIAALGELLSIPIINFRRYRSFRKPNFRREVSLEVKKRLITADNYGSLSSDTLKLVKRDIIRNHLVTIAVIAAFVIVLTIAAAIMHGEPALITSILSFGAATAFMSLAYRLLRLSPAGRLVKVKGFVFGMNSSMVCVMYYDMPRMDYRIFTQNTPLRTPSAAQLGEFVNLIGVKTKRRVRIIRILSF